MQKLSKTTKYFNESVSYYYYYYYYLRENRVDSTILT
jgi:hypothetical protein